MALSLKKTFSVLALFGALLAAPFLSFGDWTYDGATQTITDGNWTLSVNKDVSSSLLIRAVKSVTAPRVLDLRGPVTDAEGVAYPIVSIGGFNGRGDLHELYLPDTLVDIAGSAFSGCSALEKVEPFLPDSVASIGRQAFYNDAYLGGDLVARNERLTWGGESAFYGTAVRSANLPNMERVGLEFFQNCPLLVDARFPKAVDLGKWTFKNCTSLTNVVLSPSLERLQFQAFFNCPRLAKVTPFLPPTMLTLDGSAFEGCTSLKLPLVCPGLEEIGSSAFAKCAIPSADLSDVKTIGNGAFNSCPSLTEVTLGKRLETIGASAFAYCKKLVTVTPFLPASVTSIGAEAFNTCEKLPGPLTLSNPALTTFSPKSFRWMPLLDEVVFPPSSAGFSKADSLFFNSGTPGNYYFPKLAPKLPLDREVFAYVGRQRSRIYGSLRLDPEGWRAFATELTESDLAAPDYPGEKTFGVVVDPCSGVRHWLIDWISPLEAESRLDVLTSPAKLPVASTPAPGSRSDLNQGDTIECSAPATYESDDTHYTCTGYVLEELSKGRPVSATTNLGAVAFTYVHGENSGRITWLYEADGFALDAAPLEAGAGEVSASIDPNLLGRWYAKGTRVTLTAQGAAGARLTWWHGDMEEKKRSSSSPTVTMDRPRTVRAVFHPGWLYDPTTQTISDGNWLLGVTVDAAGEMAVAGKKSVQVADTLDLRGPVTDAEGRSYPIVSVWGFSYTEGLRELLLPDTLRTIKNSAFDSCRLLERVSPFLPKSVESIGNSSFNNCPALSGVLYIENPAMTNFFPRSFRALPKVNEVHFSPNPADFSKSDSLFFNSGAPGAYYFPKFAPTLPIYNETFAYTGRKRSILYGSLRLDPAGWAAIAEELTPADLAAPDYPGEKTFGVYTDPYGASMTRHWLVDWESPLEAIKSLKVFVKPGFLPLPSDPAAGTEVVMTKGETYDCSAPETFVHEGVHYRLAGYTTEHFVNGYWSAPVTNAGVSSFTYEQGAHTTRLTWLYDQDGYALDQAILDGHAGTVEVSPPADLSDGCYTTGTEVILTALPAEGDRFTWWHGDLGEVDRESATVTVTMDRPRRIRASFQGGWTYDPVARTISDGNWVLNVSAGTNDTLAINSVESVVAGTTLNLRASVTDDAGKSYPVRSIAGFGGRKDLRSVLLPDGLEAIAHYGFNECISLESVDPFLPNGVTSVGYGAFSNCQKLAGALVCRSAGLTNLPQYAFYKTAIVSADLPRVESVEDNAFMGCTALEEVRVPALVSLGASAFRDCTSLVTVEPFLPDTLVSIGMRAFYGCKKLAGALAIRNPDCKSIGDWAFFSTAIASVDLPHVETIGGFSFQKCTELAEARLPAVREFGDRAFEGCVSLATVSPFLADSVTAIAGQTFAHCPILAGDLVVRNPALKKIGATAFYGTAIRRADLPFVEELEAEVFQECTSLVEVNLPSIVTLRRWSIKACGSLLRATLSDVLETIEYQAFRDCGKLETVEPFLPASVVTIGEESFYGCASLGPVLRIPGAACKGISKNAFCRCTSLESIHLEHVEELGTDCFFNCTALTNIVLSPVTRTIGTGAFGKCTSLEKIELPRGLRSIGETAFLDCTSLVRVTPFLPDSVTALGARAFDNCQTLEGPLHLNNPAMTNLNHRSFRTTVSLNEVYFSPNSANLSVADSLFYNSGEASRYYFPKFAPKLPVDNEVFSYRGGKRSTIYGSLRLDPEGWDALATQLSPEDLAAPDYPGKKTFGVFVDPLSKTRHWLVDWRSPLECHATILLLR